jgi:hypothetical protein
LQIKRELVHKSPRPKPKREEVGRVVKKKSGRLRDSDRNFGCFREKSWGLCTRWQHRDGKVSTERPKAPASTVRWGHSIVLDADSQPN